MTKFEIILPTQLGNDIFKKCIDVFKNHCRDYVYAKHPIDELANFEHYHIGGFLHSSNTPETIVKWFCGIFPTSYGFGNNSIEKIKGHANTYLTYLMHQTKDAIEQGKSKPVEYGGTLDFDIAVKKYNAVINTNTVVDDILNGKIREYQFYSDKDMVSAVINANKLRSVQNAFACFNIQKGMGANRMNENRKQCWIFGLAGSGKTELAKHTCLSFGYKDIDIYVSSSGNNPFDDYKGQPCLIVDDVDNATFTPKTLLKLADLFTNSSVGARYFNKQIVAECIIFTSTCSPSTWWKQVSSEKTDGNVYQLYRRLNMGIWHIQDFKVECSLYNGQGEFMSNVSFELPSEIAEKVKSKAYDKALDNLHVVFGNAIGQKMSFDVNNIKIDDGFMEVDESKIPKGLL